MINTFPKSLASKALLVYLISLSLVTIVFFKYAMDLKYALIGLIGVTGFFYGSSNLTKNWARQSDKSFVSSLFTTALLIRVIWVIFSYFFYIRETGQPFEWGVADAMGYHDEAEWIASAGWRTGWMYWFGGGHSIADTGYPIYLTALYCIFGPNIVLARLFKALYSAITCVLIYRLAERNFGKSVGRMAGVFCMLMPNLIIYCGLHLKETEMLLLVTLFLERTDYLLQSRHYSFGNVLLVGILASSLFFFRTVLGAIAVISLFIGVILGPGRVINMTKKILLLATVILFAFVAGGSSIGDEVSEIWESRNENQDKQRLEQTSRGNKWAKYATGTVMAPLSFFSPFSTMVHIEGQEGQMLIHSGNFVKNCLGIFVLLAVISLLFVDKTWREHVLLEAFVAGYLIVVSSSAFANAERFHLPTLPLLLIFAAYGVSKINIKNLKYVNMWLILVVVMELVWAYFKVGSRGWMI